MKFLALALACLMLSSWIGSFVAAQSAPPATVENRGENMDNILPADLNGPELLLSGPRADNCAQEARS